MLILQVAMQIGCLRYEPRLIKFLFQAKQLFRKMLFLDSINNWFGYKSFIYVVSAECSQCYHSCYNDYLKTMRTMRTSVHITTIIVSSLPFPVSLI